MLVIHPIAYLSVILLSGTANRSLFLHTIFGIYLSVSWAVCVWGAATLLARERAMGTLSRTLSGVVDSRVILLGRSFGTSVLALSTMAIILLVYALSVGEAANLGDFVYLTLGHVAAILNGTAVGLLIGTVFVLTRFGPQVSALLTIPVLLFGGLLIPLEWLPGILRIPSALFALRWLNEYFQSVATGHIQMVPLGLFFVLCVIYFVVGWYAFGRVAERAKSRGDLALY